MATAIIVIAALALAGVAVWASADVGSGVYLRAHCRARTARRAVALTFDDGPHPCRTPRVLDLLKEAGVQATFFVVGSRAEAHPEIVERMVNEGHLVGNHTYGHSGRFPWMRKRKLQEQIEQCDAVLEKITGVRPRLFRPPFGVTNPTLARALGGRYAVIGWSIRSLDTVSRWPRERVLERIRQRLRPGAVVLLHDDRARSDVLLRMLLNCLKQTDYRAERIDNLLEL